jgi:hypothetical protein
MVRIGFFLSRGRGRGWRAAGAFSSRRVPGEGFSQQTGQTLQPLSPVALDFRVASMLGYRQMESRLTMNVALHSSPLLAPTGRYTLARNIVAHRRDCEEGNGVANEFCYSEGAEAEKRSSCHAQSLARSRKAAMLLKPMKHPSIAYLGAFAFLREAFRSHPRESLQARCPTQKTSRRPKLNEQSR